MLIVTVLTRLPTLDQPLLGLHGFRQTQTAYGSLVFHEQGIDLLHSELPVLGPPWEAPHEFPLFQASAALLMTTGLGPDVADRLASMLWFLASAVVLWVLVRRIAGGIVALASVGWYAIMPLSIFWSRAATIEYLVLTMALAAIVSTVRWVDTGHARWLGLAVLLASIASVVKVTTWAGWLFALVFIVAVLARRAGIRDRTTAAALVAVGGLSVGVGLAWTRWADAIKAASPWTGFLTSPELMMKYIWAITDRLDIGAWFVIGESLLLFVVGVAGVLVLAPGVRRIARSADRLIWLGITLSATVPILAFFGLYAHHEYYFVAVTPAWAALLGLGTAALLADAARRSEGRMVVAAVAAAALIGGLHYWGLAYAGTIDPSDMLGRAASIAERTDPDDLVVIEGEDWSPAILYYARRRGIAIPLGPLTDERRASLRAIEPALVDIVRPTEQYSRISVLETWPWVAPIGTEFYRVAPTEDRLATMPVVWTGTPPASIAATLAEAEPVELKCDGPLARLTVQLDGGQGWIGIDPANEPEARVWVGDGLGPLPARGAIQASGADISVGCAGAPQVTLRTAPVAP